MISSLDKAKKARSTLQYIFLLIIVLIMAVSWKKSLFGARQGASQIQKPGHYKKNLGWNPLNDDLLKFARSLDATLDTSNSLDTILEIDSLESSCKRHFKRVQARIDSSLPEHQRKNASSVADMLRCGKWLFLFGDFKSQLAIPEKFISFLTETFKSEVGEGFSKLGLLSTDSLSLPLGLVRVKEAPWKIASPLVGKPVGITCAACHVGQMPDGRFSIGMPNEKFDLGRFNAYVFFSLWLLDENKLNEKFWPKELQDLYRVMSKQVNRSSLFFAKILRAAAFVEKLGLNDRVINFVRLYRPTLGELKSYLNGGPNLSYASSPALPMDNLDVNFHTEIYVSQPQLWGIYTVGERNDRYHMSVLFPSNSLEHFVKVALIGTTGLSESAKRKYVEPISLYLATLKAPKNPQPQPKELVNKGHEIFLQDCSSCHNLAIGGRSLNAVLPHEVGTPDIFLNPLNAKKAAHSGAQEVHNHLAAIGGLKKAEGIYSRPLEGIWARSGLMHSGSIEDLNHLFCIGSNRRLDKPKNHPKYDGIHSDLCYHYSQEEKRALKVFLLQL